MVSAGYREGMRWDTYARISEDPHDEQRGVRRQETDTAEAVRLHRGVVGTVLTENDTSAFRKKRVRVTDASGNSYDGFRVIRPVWHEALQRLRTGDADALMVYDLDRLARDPRDLEDAIEVVEHYGKPIVSATASEIDLTTESGRMAARLMVVMANKSSADTARRVRRAALDNALAGKPVGRRAFGWTDNHSALVPSEAALVRSAVDRILVGTATVSGIAREWNEAGVQTARGNLWHNVTVRQYLRHPRLAGYRVTHGERKNAIVYDATGSPVMGQWPPLLDVATWEALQSVLVRRDSRARVPKRSHRHYLLSGLLTCGLCGAVMYGNAERDRGNVHFYYRCTEYARSTGGERAFARHTQSIQGPLTDQAVVSAVLAYLQTQDDTAAPTEPPAEWSGEADMQRAKGKVTELMSAFNDDELPGSIVFPQVREWEARISELASQRRRWQADNIALNSPILEGMLDEWPARVAAGDVTWQRGALESVLEAVMIRPRGAVAKRNEFDYGRIELVWRTR